MIIKGWICVLQSEKVLEDLFWTSRKTGGFPELSQRSIAEEVLDGFYTNCFLNMTIKPSSSSKRDQKSNKKSHFTSRSSSPAFFDSTKEDLDPQEDECPPSSPLPHREGPTAPPSGPEDHPKPHRAEALPCSALALVACWWGVSELLPLEILTDPPCFCIEVLSGEPKFSTFSSALNPQIHTIQYL